MNEEIPQFGKKTEGVEYIPRPGVYAIITDANENLAVSQVKGGYHLFGGGMELGESEEECLRREVMEEAGKKIASCSFLCRANEYVEAPAGNFYKIMSFYRVVLAEGEEVNSEPTHIFRWVTKDEFCSKAIHKAQIWVVQNL